MPSAVRPAPACQDRTAASVAGPKSPSTPRPALAFTLSRAWSADAWGPSAPRRSRGSDTSTMSLPESVVVVVAAALPPDDAAPAVPSAWSRVPMYSKCMASGRLW